jgi:hypothetical protein
MWIDGMQTSTKIICRWQNLTYKITLFQNIGICSPSFHLAWRQVLGSSRPPTPSTFLLVISRTTRVFGGGEGRWIACNLFVNNLNVGQIREVRLTSDRQWVSTRPTSLGRAVTQEPPVRNLTEGGAKDLVACLSRLRSSQAACSAQCHDAVACLAPFFSSLTTVIYFCLICKCKLVNRFGMCPSKRFQMSRSATDRFNVAVQSYDYGKRWSVTDILFIQSVLVLPQYNPYGFRCFHRIRPDVFKQHHMWGFQALCVI